MASMQQDSEELESAMRGAPGLQSVLRRCLARYPNDRFNSAAELQAELIPRMEEWRAPLATPELSNNSAGLWNKNPA
jgi:serine/threonine protein kinase